MKEDETRGSPASDSSLELVENAKLSAAASAAAEESARVTRAPQREAWCPLTDTH